jgi:hypothetical protein
MDTLRGRLEFGHAFKLPEFHLSVSVRMYPTIVFRSLLLLAFVVSSVGCQPDAAPNAKLDSIPEPATTAKQALEIDAQPLTKVIEIDAQALLAAQLPPEQLQEGWVRLFDGQSFVGWFIVGKANWQIADGIIQVSRGERSYLCTNFQIPNFELKVDFRSDSGTNSGLFLRTQPQPDDVAVDCLELNIAPPDNPFPTGSFVQRKKVEPDQLVDFDASAWHTFHVRLVGKHVQVRLDGKPIMELNDFETAATGHLSLQYNEGRVEFRNVLMRPVEATELKLDDWEQDWTSTAKDEAEFLAETTTDGLRLTGGLGQLQTKRQFADFMLQAQYSLARPEVNSGIFFRCVPDAILDGYECQVNHATVDGDPLRPADAGAGAFFRRQAARIVVGDGTQPTYITLLANGPQMVSWVNGIQVAEFTDERLPDDNPRKGLRTAAGPIALQGHDATTDVTFHRIAIVEF